MNFGDALDDLASALFDSERGRARLAPLLARWDAAVGVIREDDPHRELLQAVRTDWAVCDAAPDQRAGDRGAPGHADDAAPDTWLRRVMAAAVDDVPARETWAPLLGAHVGLFEVWPGASAWLRDVRRGFSVGLADPVRVEPLPDGGPAALWEVRVVVVNGRATLCRPPLPYPVALADRLHDVNRRRFAHGGGPVGLLTLRRQWLQFQRAPRADPAAIFRFRAADAAG